MTAADALVELVAAEFTGDRAPTRWATTDSWYLFEWSWGCVEGSIPVVTGAEWLPGFLAVKLRDMLEA